MHDGHPDTHRPVRAADECPVEGQPRVASQGELAFEVNDDCGDGHKDAWYAPEDEVVDSVAVFAVVGSQRLIDTPHELRLGRHVRGRLSSGLVSARGALTGRGAPVGHPVRAEGLEAGHCARVGATVTTAPTVRVRARARRRRKWLARLPHWPG